jgi:GNAT superfamily N-acetyltransferase
VTIENEIEFVPATREDLDVMIEWAAREGWNPGLNDADAFWATDPDGFWTARENGEMVACMSQVRHDRGFAFIGFYIVHPDRRGQGIGLALWRHVIDRLGRHVVIGLDAVVDEEMTYRKAGFFRTHRSFRFGGIPDLSQANAGGDDLIAIGPERVAAINSFDTEYFPSTRESYLEAWLSTPGHCGVAAVTNGDIQGYGVIRPCREGHKIGPLFADDAAMAERLIAKLVSDSDAEQVYLDPPFANDDALELCEKLGLERVFETVRMYRGLAPQMRFPGVFGLTSFELG